MAGVVQAQHGEIGMGQHTVGHRHVDVAPLPGALRLDDGRQDAHDTGQRTAQQVGDLEIGNGRLAAFDTDLLQHAGVAEVVDVVAGQILVRPVLAVAADRAVGNLRIDRPDRFVADTQLVHHAGAKAFDDDIRRCRQTQEDLDAFRLLQVEHHALLVAVDHAEVGTVLTRAGAQRTGVIADLRVFDLDHLCPQIGQVQGGDRPGEQAGEVKHLDAGERCRAAHDLHRPSKSASSSISMSFSSLRSMNMPR